MKERGAEEGQSNAVPFGKGRVIKGELGKEDKDGAVASHNSTTPPS